MFFSFLPIFNYLLKVFGKQLIAVHCLAEVWFLLASGSRSGRKTQVLRDLPLGSQRITEHSSGRQHSSGRRVDDPGHGAHCLCQRLSPDSARLRAAARLLWRFSETAPRAAL